MKALFLLLLVYANMGFTTADKTFQAAHSPNSIRPASESEAGRIVVTSPDACLVIMH